MEAVTGMAFTPDEVLQVGERVNNVAKAFNMREGFTRADDNLPARLMEEPIKGGESKGHKVSRAELDQMLTEYYTERGWDPVAGDLLQAQAGRTRSGVYRRSAQAEIKINTQLIPVDVI